MKSSAALCGGAVHLSYRIGTALVEVFHFFLFLFFFFLYFTCFLFYFAILTAKPHLQKALSTTCQDDAGTV